MDEEQGAAEAAPAYLTLAWGSHRFELTEAEVRELAWYTVGLYIGIWLAGGFRVR